MVFKGDPKQALKSTFYKVVFPAAPRMELDDAASKVSTLRAYVQFLSVNS